MGVQYRMLQNGGFVAGDTETGLTSYAYPTSPHATQARRQPAKVAAEMIAGEAWRALATVLSKPLATMLGEYDALNWVALHD